LIPEATDSCIKNVTNTTVSAITKSDNDVRWFSDNSGDLERTTTSLNINYLVKSGSTVTKRRYSGIRFQDLQIPKGAEISSAVLRVRTGQKLDNNNNIIDYTSVQPVSIVGFKNPNTDFCPATGCIADDVLNTAASYPLTTANVTWNPVTLSSNTWYDIDVKNIVTEMVALPTWNIGKHLAFRLWNNGTTSKDTAIRTYDHSLSYSARLEVTWTVPELTQLTALQTVRDQIEQEVNNLTIPSNTPLGAAYAEASSLYVWFSSF
jgi:type IV pilus assembly protein PilY1